MSDESTGLEKKPISYDDFIDFLVAKDIDPTCPSCGNEEGYISSEDDDFAAQTRMDVVEFDPKTTGIRNRSSTTILALSTVCGNCGYIRSYASQTVHEWLDKKKKEEI